MPIARTIAGRCSLPSDKHCPRRFIPGAKSAECRTTASSPLASKTPMRPSPPLPRPPLPRPSVTVRRMTFLSRRKVYCLTQVPRRLLSRPSFPHPRLQQQSTGLLQTALDCRSHHRGRARLGGPASQAVGNKVLRARVRQFFRLERPPSNTVLQARVRGLPTAHYLLERPRLMIDVGCHASHSVEAREAG